MRRMNSRGLWLAGMAVSMGTLAALLGAGPATPATAPATLPATTGPASVRVGDLVFSPGVGGTTAKGGVKFYGLFTNDTFTATAEKLPAHDTLTIEADLIINLSWDGSIDANAASTPGALGPDYIRVKLSDGRVLMNNTFSNATTEFAEESQTQNYPSQIPGERLPATTGAAAKNRLGFEFLRQSTGIVYKMDSTYHLKFTVPHTAEKETVSFTGFNLQEVEDENWCVANVKITGGVTPAGSIDGAKMAAEFEKAFAAALKPGEGDAAGAFGTLVSVYAVDWMRKNVTPKPIAGAEAAALIEKIIGADEGPRAEAQAKLAEMGPQAEVLLRDAARRPGLAADACDRLEWQLQVIGVTPIEDAAVKRVMLATRALELINTPEALALRKTLTQK